MLKKLLFGGTISIISFSAFAQCPTNMEINHLGVCMMKQTPKQKQADIDNAKVLFINQTQKPQKNSKEQRNIDSQFFLRNSGQ